MLHSYVDTVIGKVVTKITGLSKEPENKQTLSPCAHFTL